MATDSEPVGALTHRKAFLLHYGHGVDGRVNIWVNSWLAVVPHMAGFGDQLISFLFVAVAPRSWAPKPFSRFPQAWWASSCSSAPAAGTDPQHTRHIGEDYENHRIMES